MFTRTLSQNAQAALAILGKSDCLPKATYLAGGSALALHFGHRISVDFDFFTPTPFVEDDLAKKLKDTASFVLERKSENTLLGLFESVKFSIFLYEYPLLFKPAVFKEIRIADPKDIGAMKLAAIMGRGTKKDFVDLYALIHRGITVDDCFKYYDKKYKALANNLYSLVTSIGYFEEAEKTDMPEMIEEISWNDVKNFFGKEAVRLAKKYI